MNYKPKDFEIVFNHLPTNIKYEVGEQAAYAANKKLKEWLDEAPTVYKHEWIDVSTPADIKVEWRETKEELSYLKRVIIGKVVCVEEIKDG